MKRYVVGLLLLASIQMHASQIVFSDANPPGKRTYQEVASGTLDSNFGSSGAYTTASGQQIKAVKVLKDGNILAGGGDSSGMRLEKIKKDGSGLVSSWGTSGVYQAASGYIVYAVEELSNGKILVASNDGSDSRIEQLTAAGALDTANFGSSGIYALSGVQIYAMKVRPTGEILVGGTDGSNAIVKQLTSAGALDTSNFGTSGVYTGVANGTIYAMELLSNKKLLVAGDNSADARVEQLTSAGAIDTDNFGTSGVYTAPSATIAVRSMQIRPTGEILISMSSSGGWKIAQLTALGALDTANFGSSGIYTSATASASDDIPYALVLLGDKRALVAGYDKSSGWRLECITSAGALDAGFGTSGAYASATATATGDELFAMAIHPEYADIILAGDDNNQWRMERVKNNLDPLKNYAALAGGLIYSR